MIKTVKIGLVSLYLTLFVACSTVPQKHQVQKLYPVLSPCTKPIFVLNTNQDLVFALEQTELARSLCSAQVDAVIKIQEQP